ncbi:GH14207 [Drosophila grimshawi]|uniref:procollagen-proline 4-dioxygenase n=1 Tax=Drosophila grimshawi TaxID=7222 RepID=B4JY05_DROGR|nr:GH14207 [Drosophila grimshawi]
MSGKLELLKLNVELIENLNNYVNQMQQKIDKLSRLSQQLANPLKLAMGREKEFLSNPFNIFSLIRHMSNDWTQLESVMQQPVVQAQMDYMRERRAQLPQFEDLEEAAAAMHRIQVTFRLDPMEMANGWLDGTQYDARLSYLDCFELGKHSFRMDDMGNATNWLLTARQLMAKESPSDLYEILNVTSSDIAWYLANSLAAAGNLNEARDVLLNEPKLNSRTEELLAEFMKYEKPEYPHDPEMQEADEKYTRLCGASHKPKPSRLICNYKMDSSPFLRLAPLKMEMLSMDPYVVVFHEAIYDSEIDELRRLCESRLSRTEIAKQGKNKSIRSSSGVWIFELDLNRQQLELLERIRRRVADMSGLLIDFNSQEVQYMEYVFGGHYYPHWDFKGIPHLEDRIATVLFYLNDVARGGATIFPDLELLVQPERGKVLHWHNMDLGTYDLEKRSLHGACPVIMGKKEGISFNYLLHLDLTLLYN